VGELEDTNSVKAKSYADGFFDKQMHNLDDLITDEYKEKTTKAVNKAFSGKI
jgi:hypothetical protein